MPGSAFTRIIYISEGGDKALAWVLTKEASKVEEKKEAGFPILVVIIIIGIAALLVVGFIVFLK